MHYITPEKHKPLTKMVKQTHALTQTLTLRKLLGHFMSTLPRLHAYDTPCRDLNISRMKAEIHMHTKTQAKQRVNTTPLSLSVCL